MKKVFFVLATLLFSALTAWSQSENIEPQEKAESVNDYLKGTDGLFYVLIPVDEILAEGHKAEISTINDQNGFTSIRMSSIWIEDVKAGRTCFITLRRFDNERLANDYIEMINDNHKLIKHNAVAISQNNYRTFLKKKDFEAYKNFINKDN